MGKIEINRPPLASYQKAFIDDTHDIVVVEASTKSGKTAGMLVWLMEQAFMGESRIVWWVAPVYSQAKIAYDRFSKNIIRLQKVSQKQGLKLDFEITKSPMKIKMPNGSRVEFLSADNYNALYGQDVNAVVIDEATRCKEDAWHAIRSTLTATKGKARLIGNVRGRKNWVHKLAQKENVSYHLITAWDAVNENILEKIEIEKAKEDLPENVYRELYLAEPADDGGNPFNINKINNCTVKYTLDKTKVKYFGIDLAKSHDWSVAIGIDNEGTVQFFDRWQSDWSGTINRLKKIIGSIPSYIDSTGVGDPIYEALQPHCKSLHGFKYSSTSKQQLMLLLASHFHQESVKVPEGTELVNELLMFEYNITSSGRVQYDAPQGLHDDCVNALALAVNAKEHLRPNQNAMIFPGYERNKAKR